MHPEVIESVVAAVRRKCDPSALVAAHATARSASPQSGIIAIGKAAATMALALAESDQFFEPDWPNWRGLIAVPHGTNVRAEMRVCKRLYFAGHPLPDSLSLTVAREATRGSISYPSKSHAFDPDLWVLLSGGASALMALPPSAISLDEYRALVNALLLAGAPIQDLNTVRKHIDLVKGGRLAQHYTTLRIELLILSDVIGDDVSSIGSGPFSPDPTAFFDALYILEKYACLDVAPAITEYLREGVRGNHPETPKPGDPCFANIKTTILAGNQLAIRAAEEELRSFNIDIREASGQLVGPAAEAGRRLARDAIQLQSSRHRAAIIRGGETTVQVHTPSDANQSSSSSPAVPDARGGRGGRNQELALAAAIELDGHQDITIATFATDGVDGPTDAAGAIVTGQTCTQARSIGLNPADSLARHDSHTFFDSLDKSGFPHLLRTGPTGTNVNDIAIALIH